MIFFLRSGKRSRSDAPTISLSPSDALCHESTSNDVSVGETMNSLKPSCSEPAPTAGYVNTMGQIDLGVLIHAAHGSIDRLRHLSQEMTDAQKI